MSITIRGVQFESNLDNPMGLEFYNLSHRFGFQSPNWPYFEDVKIERIHYMAKSGVLSQRITTSHAQHHAHRRPRACRGRTRRSSTKCRCRISSAPALWSSASPKICGSQITWRRSRKSLRASAVRPGDVHHRQYRLAPANMSDSEEYFCLVPGFRAFGGRLVRREKGQGGRPRHAGQRSSARHRHRSRIATGRCIPHLAEEFKAWSGGIDWKEAHFRKMGACASQAVHQRHSGHRERRRRPRRGDRQARHVRVFPLELGSRRRLHHSPRGDDRQVAKPTASKAALISPANSRFRVLPGGRDACKTLTRDAKPYEAPNHRGCRRACACRVSSRERPDQPMDRATLSSCRGAARDRIRRRSRRSMSFVGGEMTVIVGGEETVLKRHGFLRDRARRNARGRQPLATHVCNDAGRDPLSAGSQGLTRVSEDFLRQSAFAVQT